MGDLQANIYKKKIKMPVRIVHKIEVFVLCEPKFLSHFFCKYGPDKGPVRPKLVANSSVTIKYCTVVSDGVYV